jgi:hypothetical protein
MLWKLAASATQTLCKCVMSNNICILSYEWGFISAQVHKPYFYHKMFAQRGFAHQAIINSSNPRAERGITVIFLCLAIVFFFRFLVMDNQLTTSISPYHIFYRILSKVSFHYSTYMKKQSFRPNISYTFVSYF